MIIVRMYPLKLRLNLEISILLECGTVSLGDWRLLFQGRMLVSSSRIELYYIPEEQKPKL